MALIIVDASVVIGLLDASDSLHAGSTTALLDAAGDDVRLPASAYAECLVGPVKRGALEQLRELMAAMGLRVEPLTAQIAERAAELRARFRALRLPDAFVLATGEALSADVVLTGDASWRRVNARVRVVR